LVDESAPVANPGQFHMLALENAWGGGAEDRPWLARAISFLSNNEDGSFEFLIDSIGPGTRLLSEVAPGERIWVAGPFGNGFQTVSDSRHPVLVGGGIGAAPIIALAQSLNRQGQDHTSVFGFRTSAHAAVAADLPGSIVTTDDGSVGLKGNVVEALNGLALDNASLYACGPPAMLQAIAEYSRIRGLACQVALESPMACGFGACFGCAVQTSTGIVRLCVDGPVLDASLFEGVDLRTAAGA
jgi:NAD(P)H-flavin reductase